MHWFAIEMTRFFTMGGYARFIWPAYGIAFAVLLINIYLPWRERRAFLKKLKN